MEPPHDNSSLCYPRDRRGNLITFKRPSPEKKRALERALIKAGYIKNKGIWESLETVVQRMTKGSIEQ
jgi:hypothetical protein